MPALEPALPQAQFLVDAVANASAPAPQEGVAGTILWVAALFADLDLRRAQGRSQA
jgi:hypothetical protein